MPEFYEKHLSINLDQYSNIGVDFYISRWLLLLFAIITVGALFNHYRKSCALMLLNELLDRDAIGDACAESTDNLLVRGLALKIALSYRKVSRLLSTSKVKENHEQHSESREGKKEKQKLIYIRERRYEEARELSEATCPSIGKSILFFVLMLSIYVCILFALPELLMFINNLL